MQHYWIVDNTMVKSRNNHTRMVKVRTYDGENTKLYRVFTIVLSTFHHHTFGYSPSCFRYFDFSPSYFRVFVVSTSCVCAMAVTGHRNMINGERINQRWEKYNHNTSYHEDISSRPRIEPVSSVLQIQCPPFWANRAGSRRIVCPVWI